MMLWLLLIACGLYGAHTYMNHVEQSLADQLSQETEQRLTELETSFNTKLSELDSSYNEKIAALMNELFVNIKVDREERPDLDEIYMNAVQLLTGRGGWPMTMFLTPDRKPFYGGTYFPPEDRHGMPGFPRILLGVSQAYREKPEDVEKSVSQILAALQRMSETQETAKPFSSSIIADAAENIARAYDAPHASDAA